FRKIYTTRVFNYFAANRYILATIPPESLVAELIGEASPGNVIGPGRKKAIKESIWAMFEEFKKNGMVTVRQNKQVISKFDKVEQTRKLADVFNELIEGRR
ncbi:MAG: hypothetical protein KAI64_01150, partial [Thermoplasmata archaeon]|nr:hypothetical protein [Thermoplasmata archaeon]